MASPAASRSTRRPRRSGHTAAPTRTPDLFLLVAAVVGLLVSAYLALVDLIGGSTLCLAVSDCDAVRASTYGHVAGLPVAALGTGYFLAVLLTAMLRAPWQPRVLQILGGVGLGTTIVFVGIQGLVLRAWCPHCQAQKQMFGAAATKLPYVECDPRGSDAHPDLCQVAGVRAYPTWVIGGQRLEGEVSPAELARLSGFGG